VQAVGLESPHLASVIAFWRWDSRQLGMFPRGAFADAARLKRIRAAMTPDGEVAAGTCCSVSRGSGDHRALCVGPAFRNAQWAAQLFYDLKY
jgi:hypothetical protein